MDGRYSLHLHGKKKNSVNAAIDVSMLIESQALKLLKRI